MNENKRVLINGLTKQEIEATASCVGLINGESKQAEPMVRLTRSDVETLIEEDVFLGNCYEITNEIMDAMIKKNGG